ncbi:MAG: 50S ribosomal protein L23 [Candidatus Pacebacteria bacterium]|nr:50S ribosomal protein L23 [Candidatus Paceibacterota bacterium]
MAIFKKTEEKKKNANMIAWQVLDRPYISEKATDLSKENKYIFVVSDKSNKNQVKQAIEELYGVNVLSVNVLNVNRKKKRLGKFTGWKKGFKKAIVEIKEGQRIDIV